MTHIEDMYPDDAPGRAPGGAARPAPRTATYEPREEEWTRSRPRAGVPAWARSFAATGTVPEPRSRLHQDRGLPAEAQEDLERRSRYWAHYRALQRQIDAMKQACARAILANGYGTAAHAAACQRAFECDEELDRLRQARDDGAPLRVRDFAPIDLGAGMLVTGPRNEPLLDRQSAAAGESAVNMDDLL